MSVFNEWNQMDYNDEKNYETWTVKVTMTNVCINNYSDWGMYNDRLL